MIILTTFFGLAFASSFFSLCWLTDKYSDTLDELDEYKHHIRFLENQNKELKELREVYKNALQSYKSRVKRNSKNH